MHFVRMSTSTELTYFMVSQLFLCREMNFQSHERGSFIERSDIRKKYHDFKSVNFERGMLISG